MSTPLNIEETHVTDGPRLTPQCHVRGRRSRGDSCRRYSELGGRHDDEAEGHSQQNAAEQHIGGSQAPQAGGLRGVGGKPRAGCAMDLVGKRHSLPQNARGQTTAKAQTHSAKISRSQTHKRDELRDMYHSKGSPGYGAESSAGDILGRVVGCVDRRKCLGCSPGVPAAVPAAPRASQSTLSHHRSTQLLLLDPSRYLPHPPLESVSIIRTFRIPALDERWRRARCRRQRAKLTNCTKRTPLEDTPPIRGSYAGLTSLFLRVFLQLSVSSRYLLTTPAPLLRAPSSGPSTVIPTRPENQGTRIANHTSTNRPSALPSPDTSLSTSPRRHAERAVPRMGEALKPLRVRRDEDPGVEASQSAPSLQQHPARAHAHTVKSHSERADRTLQLYPVPARRSVVKGGTTECRRGEECFRAERAGWGTREAPVACTGHGGQQDSVRSRRVEDDANGKERGMERDVPKVVKSVVKKEAKGCAHHMPGGEMDLTQTRRGGGRRRENLGRSATESLRAKASTGERTRKAQGSGIERWREALGGRRFGQRMRSGTRVDIDSQPRTVGGDGVTPHGWPSTGSSQFAFIEGKKEAPPQRRSRGGARWTEGRSERESPFAEHGDWKH
ncbi:hypothetical protein C8R45DRAFT_929623 [Mycena sanguinolenta]|nr:hypothetical protein C8R45DRAFT_929623 [Mycena sanguinolenta]